MTSSSAESKQFIGRYLQALSGQAKKPDLVGRFVSDAGLRAHIRDVEAAFPAYEFAAEDLIAEGDKVAMRATFRGTHQGTFAGIPPTGRAVSVPFMVVYRIDNGLIAEHWLHFDGAALVAQLQPVAAKASSTRV